MSLTVIDDQYCQVIPLFITQLETSLYCNDDCFYGILCYDEYQEFKGIKSNIRCFFFVIIKWFLGVWLFSGIKYLFN